MMSRVSVLSAFCASVLLAYAIGPSASLAATITYSASLNSLPSSQGFTLLSPSGTAVSQLYTVASPTALHIGQPLNVNQTLPSGATTDGESEFWFRNDLPINFLTTGVDIQASIKLQSNSTSVASTTRQGFVLGAIDSTKRTVNLWIGKDTLLVENYDSQVQATVSFNTTDDYHVYRISVDPVTDMATLRVDGIVKATNIPMGAINPALTTQRIGFGDGSSLAGAESLIRSASFNNLVPVPEPTTGCLLVVGSIALAAFQRRRMAR